MVEPGNSNFRKRIIEEMTTDYSNALEKNFELAKRFIRITKDGKVDVLVKAKVTGKESILLYLIGKLYANEAEFAETGNAGNKELMDELGIAEGSLLPWLKDLRDGNQIKQVRKERYVYHFIPVNLVEKALKAVELKLQKSD